MEHTYKICIFLHLIFTPNSQNIDIYRKVHVRIKTLSLAGQERQDCYTGLNRV